MLSVNNEENLTLVRDIHSIIIRSGDFKEIVNLFVEVQMYQHVTDDNGDLKYYPSSQRMPLFVPTILMVDRINVTVYYIKTNLFRVMLS